jgi:hypothetical protein
VANEYADLATLRAQLSMQVSDTSRDALLSQALSTASRSIDRTTGRRFYLDAVAQQRIYNPYRRVLSEEQGEVLLTDDIGSAAGLVVETGSGSTYTAVTGYETIPDNALLDGQPITGLLRPRGIWTWRCSSITRVRITARWGWPAVPAEVVQATLIQANRLFKRKDSPEGIIGSAEWGVRNLSRRDPDVYALIENLIRPGFG